MKKIKSLLFASCILGLTISTGITYAQEKSRVSIAKGNYNESTKTFDVTVTKPTDARTFKSISVAIWSEENGQDDLKWYDSNNIVNGRASIQFNLANHGNRAGKYITHVYTTYSDGQVEGIALPETKVDVKTPKLEVKNDKIQITENVAAPGGATYHHAVWTGENGQDDLKWYITDSPTMSVDLSNHRGYGTYFVHTYVNQGGKMIAISGQSIYIDSPRVLTNIIQTSDKSYDVVISNVPDYITSVSVPTWSYVNGQDDLKWYTATKIAPNTYKTTILLTNHGFDFGNYGVHIYGQSAITKQNEALSGSPGFKVDSISGLENPSININNVNTSDGTFTVTVLETAMSKKITELNLQVVSKSNYQKVGNYVAKTSSYGKITQTVDLKALTTVADAFTVKATVIYSDNNTVSFNLADQSYSPQIQSTIVGSPKITNYINETNTYPVGQCTWAVKSLAPWIPNWLGNANGWAINARAKGFRVGTTPRVGSIVVWPNDGGGYGHVAFVTNVESNARIQVKEANYAGKQYISNFRGWFNPLDSFWGGNVSYIYPD